MPRKRQSYHHGNLRAKLVEAGAKLIADKGMDALTLREIGARLGVSRAAPYRHFHDKADLVAAIREAGFIQFADTLEAALRAAGPDFASRLEALGLAYVRFAAAHRAHLAVMFLPGGEPKPGTAGERAFTILLDTIRQGQSTGEVREGDPMILARFVWSSVHGVSLLEFERDFSDQGAGAKLVRTFTDLLRNGIAR